jgi:hypothetical protein
MIHYLKFFATKAIFLKLTLFQLSKTGRPNLLPMLISMNSLAFIKNKQKFCQPDNGPTQGTGERQLCIHISRN